MGHYFGYYTCQKVAQVLTHLDTLSSTVLLQKHLDGKSMLLKKMGEEENLDVLLDGALTTTQAYKVRGTLGQM